MKCLSPSGKNSILQGILDLQIYLDIAWLFACPRGTPEHHIYASRTCPTSWYSFQTLAQYESDKMDSWPSGVLAKFAVFHQCQIQLSLIHLTTLPVSIPQMSKAFFPDTTAKFCVMSRNEWCSHKHSTMLSYPLQFSAHGSSRNL